MGSRQSGFTLVETVVTAAVLAMLLAAGGVWMLSLHPGSLRAAGDETDATIAAARSIAASSGNGATIVFAPRRGGGFTESVYSGRPNAPDAVHPTTVLTVTSDASVRENTLGAPPFALFLSSAGHPSGIAAYPSIDASGNMTFGTIAAQPPCPAGGIVLTFTAPRGGATDTRRLSCDTIVAGAASANPSPTPNVPLLTPKAMLAHWTRDAAPLKFVATEWGYTHWFASATGMQCGSIATYPSGSPYSAPYSAAEGAALPSPPFGTAYSYPNSNGQSMNDAPAAFALQPIAGSPGLCTADVVDDYGQHATSSVQIMGDLTPSATTLTFANPTAPAQSLTFSKSYDTDAAGIQLRFGGTCGQVIYYPPTTTNRTIATTLSATDISTARISVQPNGTIAAKCTLLVSDQYGEPPISIAITIGHPTLRTWPLAVKYAPSGSTFLASANMNEPGAWLNGALGGGIARAASSCKAQAFSDPGTFASPDANPPSNVRAQLNGVGVTINAMGCYVAAADGITPVNAPLIVWEPDGSTQTYTPQTQACGFLVKEGSWSPGRTAPMASLDTAGGSGSGTCTVALDDGSGATLSFGNGLVAARVVASTPVYASASFYGSYCTGSVCTGLPGGTGGTGGTTNPCRKDCPGDGKTTITNVRYYVSNDGGYTWSIVETIYDTSGEKSGPTCTDPSGTTVPCASITTPSPITYRYESANPAGWYPVAPPGTTGM